MNKTVKLHEYGKVPRMSKINCEVSDGSKYVIFHRLDGMYSYCVSENKSVCHLHCNTELSKNDDGSFDIVSK